MKYLFLILFLCISFIARADVFEIDAFGKVASVSKLAKEGKISVFVISTKWCKPCHKLWDDLKQANLDMNDIDIWYIDMSGKQNYQKVKKTNAYFSWRVYERLEEWPFVYITSPTTNVYKKFSDKTLAKEGEKTSVLEEILAKVKFLQDKAKEYPQLTDFDILTGNNNNVRSFNNNGKPQSSESDVNSLKEQVAMLNKQILEQNQNIEHKESNVDSLKQQVVGLNEQILEQNNKTLIAYLIAGLAIVFLIITLFTKFRKKQ